MGSDVDDSSRPVELAKATMASGASFRFRGDLLAAKWSGTTDLLAKIDIEAPLIDRQIHDESA